MLFFRKKYNIKQKDQVSSKQIPLVTNFYFTRKRAAYITSVCKGSLTLEASLVLPFLIAVFTAFIFLIQAIQIQIQLQKALYNQAMNVSGYAYYMNTAGMDNMAENMLEAEYVKYSVINELGADYLDKTSIVNGSKGIKTVYTLEADEGILDVALKYEMEVPFNLFGIKPLSFIVRARCHMWTGANDEDKESEFDMVYVAATGSVYHIYEDCSYLVSTIEDCKISEIENLRNASGGKYYPCAVCCGEDAKSSIVFYSKYGTRYHLSPLCRCLHSDVFVMEREKAEEKYGLCSKCKGR